MIQFLCDPSDKGIPEPYPARKLMPEWFKNLHQRINPDAPKGTKNNSTIKRCSPFLDALCAGWIILLAADVEITSTSGATGVTWKCDYHRPLIETHGQAQVTGNPNSPMPPLKFINPWFIKMPPGYSMLFVPPLNRPDFRFQCFSGLVDDGYMGQGALEAINFPFFFTQPNYTGILKAGTPLVQAIPIARDSVLKSSRTISTGELSADDLALIQSTRERREQDESMYRNKLWEPV